MYRCVRRLRGRKSKNENEPSGTVRIVPRLAPRESRHDAVVTERGNRTTNYTPGHCIQTCRPADPGEGFGVQTDTENAQEV